MHSFESIVAQMPEMFAIKDTDLKMMACNKQTMAFLGYTSMDSIAGISDYDIRCDAVRFADLFRNQDTRVIEGEELSFLNIVKYADDNLHIMHSQKKPFYDGKGNIVGIICQSVETPLQQMSRIIHKITHEHYPSPRNANDILGTYQLSQFDSPRQLSNREQEALYYTIRGLSAKQASIKMKCSAKAVEYHIQNLKTKFDVFNKSQLIEISISEGFMYFIPPTLLNDGSYFIE